MPTSPPAAEVRDLITRIVRAYDAFLAAELLVPPQPEVVAATRSELRDSIEAAAKATGSIRTL